MKRIPLVIFLIIFIFLSACGTKPPQETPIQQTTPEPTEVSLTYPIQNNAYPSPIMTEEQASSSPIIGDISYPNSETPDPEKSPVIISKINHDANGLETIYITNISDQSQDINGFSLIIPSSTEHINIFNKVLEPGDSYIVYNGQGAKEQTDGLIWLETQIIQQPGDSVFLLNRAGRLIWSFVYYP